MRVLRPKVAVIWFFLVILLGLGESALADGCPLPAIDLKQAAQGLADRFCFRLDPDGSLDIDTVAAQTENLTPVVGDRLSFGYTRSVVWLKIPLQWQGTEADDWLLNFDYPLLDDVRLYARDGQGGWQVRRVGDRLPFVERPIHHREFLFPLRRPADLRQDLYVRMETTSSMQVYPQIVQASDFFHADGNRQILYGLVYGVMLMMTLYNAFLFLAIRDPSYLAYVFSVLSGTLFLMALNGHAFQYLWPTSPALANVVVPLSSSLWMVGTAIFAQLFLETRQYSPALSRMLSVMAGLAGCCVLLALLADYRLAIEASTTLALANGSLILISSIWCWTKGNRSARFFTLAWLVYTLGIGMLILSRFSVLPTNFLTQNSAALGLLAEIIILSLALSDKYRILHEELSRYSRDLEERVAERTEALERANEFLHKMSRRDALTNLANRLGFDEYLSQEWNRQRRGDQQIALLLCDVDHFKGYNDSYGHQAGDLCLQGVAGAIDGVLKRPADLGARYGGDELAVILPETDAEGAGEVAESIVEAVRGLDIEHRASPRYQRVTVSIGVAAMYPSRAESPGKLLATADRALYQAKENGRNQATIFDADLIAKLKQG